MKYRFLVIFLLLFSCRERHDSIIESCEQLKPLTKPKHPVRKGEWRESHNEAQESLQDYIAKRPPSATAKRNKLYVVQLGSFDARGKEILEETKLYLNAFFQIGVAELPVM